MKKNNIILGLFVTLLANQIIGQNIELDWTNNFVNKKNPAAVASSFDAADGIVINGVPAGTIILDLTLVVNNVNFRITDSGNAQAMFGNLGNVLTSHFATNNSITLKLLNKQTAVGDIQIVKSGGQPPKTTQVPNSKEYEDAVEAAYGLKIKSGVIKLDRRLNQAKQKNIIHIFLDEKGNFYYSSLPTTAREDNIYIFHVFYKEEPGKRFRLEYEGVFDPKFEVFGAEGTTQEIAGKNSTGQPIKIKIAEQTFGAIGPFTTSFTIKIFPEASATPILNKSVSVAKLHHVTLNAGLYGTFLRYPQSVTILERPATADSTLVADDPTSRGFITVMLTWYPMPRNILFPSNSWKEKIGFNLGTSISKKLAENFFGGLSYDIARGLSITGGVHYGRQNYIVGFPDFEFGEDKFSGSLDNRVKKRWQASFYVGMNMDFRLLSYIFNPSQTIQQ